MKQTCKCCGDKYTVLADEDPCLRICQECFDDREASQGGPDYEQCSDADPGL